jgi:hypothetical protein
MTSLHLLPADDESSVESFLRGKRGKNKRGPTLAERRRVLAERKHSQGHRCPDCNVRREVVYLNPAQHDLYAGKPLTCPECGTSKTPVSGRGRLPLGLALLADLRSIREASRDPIIMAQRLAEGATELDELRRRGWTDERIRGAVAAVVEPGRMAPSPPGRAAASTLTASGGLRRPPAAPARLVRRPRPARANAAHGRG